METPIQIPTCGRMVHYIPVLPDIIKAQNPDYCKALPATVVEASDLYANMVVLNMGSNPAEAKYSVPHKSVVAKNEDGEPVISYWQWPTIK